MSSFDPLDAPLKTPKVTTLPPYICSPRQMVLFKRALLVLIPLNTCIYALLFIRQWAVEYFFWGIALQGITAGMLSVVISFFAIVKRRDLPYVVRVWQWLVLYYLSVQVVFTVLLVVFIFARFLL